MHFLKLFQGLINNVLPSTFAEDLDINKFPTPAEYVKETALEKASLYLRQEDLLSVRISFIN